MNKNLTENSHFLTNTKENSNEFDFCNTSPFDSLLSGRLFSLESYYQLPISRCVSSSFMNNSNLQSVVQTTVELLNPSFLKNLQTNLYKLKQNSIEKLIFDNSSNGKNCVLNNESSKSISSILNTDPTSSFGLFNSNYKLNSDELAFKHLYNFNISNTKSHCMMNKLQDYSYELSQNSQEKQIEQSSLNKEFNEYIPCGAEEFLSDSLCQDMRVSNLTNQSIINLSILICPFSNSNYSPSRLSQPIGVAIMGLFMLNKQMDENVEFSKYL